MKIRLIKLITGGEGRFGVGEVLDLEPQRAYSLIAAGAATSIEPEIPEAAPEIETAVIKTKRGKHK